MKKAILSIVAALALIGCNNRSEVEPLQANELEPMQQSWRGVLPCADCSGIETSLFLAKDGSWVMDRRYLGKPASTVSGAYGNWARTADKLVLTDSTGGKSWYRVKDDRLEMLDRQGNPLTSSHHYLLRPVRASLPATPMAMRGMYIATVDAATFIDCATGRRVPVADDASLTRDYAAARGGETRPLLLLVTAHFVLQEDPQTGEQVKALAADGQAKFIPGKDCND